MSSTAKIGEIIKYTDNVTYKKIINKYRIKEY